MIMVAIGGVFCSTASVSIRSFSRHGVCGQPWDQSTEGASSGLWVVIVEIFGSFHSYTTFFMKMEHDAANEEDWLGWD